MPLYLQTFGFPEIADKALSTDPITLMVIAIVIGALTFLALTLVNSKRENRDDDLREMIFKAFTDDKSPIVKSNNAVAEGNRLVAAAVDKQTAALTSLGQKTDDQTNELKGVRSDSTTFQTLMTADLSKQTETISSLTASVNVLNSTFNNGMAEIRGLLRQHIENPHDCADIENKFENLKVDLFRELSRYVKRVTDTGTMQPVTIESQSTQINAADVTIRPAISENPTES